VVSAAAAATPLKVAMQAASVVLVAALRLKVMLGLVPLAPEVAHASSKPSVFLPGLKKDKSTPNVAPPSSLRAQKAVAESCEQ